MSAYPLCLCWLLYSQLKTILPWSSLKMMTKTSSTSSWSSIPCFYTCLFRHSFCISFVNDALTQTHKPYHLEINFYLCNETKKTPPPAVHITSCNWLPFHRPCSFASQTFIWFADINMESLYTSCFSMSMSTRTFSLYIHRKKHRKTETIHLFQKKALHKHVQYL